MHPKLFQAALKVSALVTITLLVGATTELEALAQARRTRTGPRGNSITRTRQVQNGQLIRTRTGPRGNSINTTRQAEEGQLIRTRTGPEAIPSPQRGMPAASKFPAVLLTLRVLAI